MIDTIRALFIDKDHLRDKFALSFSKRLFPDNYGGIRTFKKGHGYTLREIPFFGLIALADILQVFRRYDALHPVGKIFGVPFMVYLSRGIHQVIHYRVCNIPYLLVRHFFEVHKPSERRCQLWCEENPFLLAQGERKGKRAAARQYRQYRPYGEKPHVPAGIF